VRIVIGGSPLVVTCFLSQCFDTGGGSMNARLRLYCASANETLKTNLPLLTALFDKFSDSATPSVRGFA
jgi:hypothetical protein